MGAVHGSARRPDRVAAEDQRAVPAVPAAAAGAVNLQCSAALAAAAGEGWPTQARAHLQAQHVGPLRRRQGGERGDVLLQLALLHLLHLLEQRLQGGTKERAEEAGRVEPLQASMQAAAQQAQYSRTGFPVACPGSFQLPHPQARHIPAEDSAGLGAFGQQRRPHAGIPRRRWRRLGLGWRPLGLGFGCLLGTTAVGWHCCRCCCWAAPRCLLGRRRRLALGRPAG